MVDATNRNPTREHLVLFFVVTFAFSWLLWLLPVLRSNGISELPEAVGLLGILAPFGPSVAAFWLVWRSGGRPAVRNLWLRGWRAGFERKWLIPALGLMPVIALVNVILVVVLGGQIDWGVASLP